MSDVTVGIDLAKNVFSLHGVDAEGAVVLRRSVNRAKLLELIAQLSPCLIGMEACSGAHDWARRFSRFGHRVRLMAPKFVAPYRASGKNDSRQRRRGDLRGGQPPQHALCAGEEPRAASGAVPASDPTRVHRGTHGDHQPLHVDCLRSSATCSTSRRGRRPGAALLEEIADAGGALRRGSARSRARAGEGRHLRREIEAPGIRGTVPSPSAPRDVRVSARSLPPRSSPPSAMRGNSRADDSSLPGSDSCRAVLDRRQDPPRTHRASRRRLPADAARDGCALRTATRLARAARLPPRLRRHRRPERTRALGCAREGAGVVAPSVVIRFIAGSSTTLREIPPKQVRPALVEPDQRLSG